MPVNLLAGAQAIPEAQKIIAAESAAIKETEPQRETRETLMSELKKGETGRLGLRILRELVQNVAAAGIDLSTDKIAKNTRHKLKDEYDLMLEGKEEGQDKLDIRQTTYTIKSAGHMQEQNQDGQKDSSQPYWPQETKEAIRDFIDNYSRYLVSGASELKKKSDEIEAKLQGRGVSARELLSIKNNVRRSVRAEIVGQIREAFINKIFSQKPNSMEQVMAERALNDLLNAAATNQQLGGEDFGNYQLGLVNTIKDMGEKVKSDVRDFVHEETTEKFIGLLVNRPEDLKEIEALVKLGEKVGFDQEAFIQEWHKKFDDLGLTPFVPPNATASSSSGQNNSQQNSPNQEAAKIEEKDILGNQLRAIYMQRAIKGDYLTVINTSFRMRKLKNGLIKLGLKVEDFKRLEKEGRAVAVARCQEMLEEVLAERATLYELSGPAFRLVDARQKSIQRNMDRLGAPVDDEAISQLIGKIDVKMHELAMDELSILDAALKTGPHEGKEKKRGQLIKLIIRLRAEAGISGPVIYPNSVSDRT